MARHSGTMRSIEPGTTVVMLKAGARQRDLAAPRPAHMPIGPPTTDLNEIRIVLPMSSVRTVTYVPGCSIASAMRSIVRCDPGEGDYPRVQPEYLSTFWTGMIPDRLG